MVLVLTFDEHWMHRKATLQSPPVTVHHGFSCPPTNKQRKGIESQPKP